MAKRILSLVLTCALLLGCISGLTLIASAETVVKVFNGVPGWNNMDNECIGTFQGFDVIQWKGRGGGLSFNNGSVANAMGLPGGTEVDLEIKVDYYWDKVEGGDGAWLHFRTTNIDGSYTPDDGFGSFTTYGIEPGGWKEITVAREAQTLGMGGKDDLYINVAGDQIGAANALYIRGLSFKATDGEGNVYYANWGSYLTASIDFKSGTPVLKNMTGLASRGGEDQYVVEAIGETGISGAKIFNGNNGMKFWMENMPAFTEPMAVAIEYYMDSTVIDGNSRINFRTENGARQSYVLRKGMYTGADVVNENKDLVADQAGLYTFVLSDANALEALHGELGFIWWPGKTGDYAHILSISIFPASQLNAIEDPGYDYIDFTNNVSTNPYYPDYKEADIVGMKWSLNGTEGNGTITENGMEMTSGTLYIDSARARGKSPIGVKVYFAEGTTGNFTFQYNADPEKVADNPNYTGTNPEIGEDGVAAFILDNAKFDGKQNAGCSARMYADGKTIERIEIYTMADKTALNEAIAKEIDFTGKTATSIAAYNAAKEAAQAVADNAWATEGEIAGAVAKLAAAEADLKNIREVGYGTKLGHNEFDYFFTVVPRGDKGYEDEGQNIGYTDEGEWFEYEVNVKEDGLYNINVDMGTGNADSTIEVQDGNGKVYGSFVVPSKGWGPHDIYTVTASLQAGVQKLRIVYKKSSANYFGLTLTDARYTLTGATVEMNANGNNSGSIVKKEGKYAWYMGHNQYLAIKPTDAAQFANVENVVLEATVWIPANEDYQTSLPNGEWATNRRFLSGFSGYSGSTMTNATRFTTGEWATVTWTTAESFGDDTEKNLNGVKAGNKAEVWFFDENCKIDEAFGGAYISKIKVYDAANADNYIEISFADTTNKIQLQAEVDAAITDGSIYSDATWTAYQEALAAAQAVLDDDAAIQGDVDAALVNLQAAKAALADKRYTLNNATTDMNPNSTVLADGIITLGDNQYAWVVGGTPENKVGNKWVGIGDPNGILANSTSVTYEYDIMFDSAANLNARVFLAYGKKGAGWIDVRDNGDDFNGFAAHGNWLPGNMVGTAPANGEWGTIAIKNDNYDPTIQVNGCITRLGFWAEETNIYVKAIRAYDSEDPTKMISLTFSKVPGKDDLQAALDNAVNTDSYTAASVEAYNAALAAIEELLAKDEVTESEVVAALAALEAAEAALAPAHSNMTFENDEIHNVNSNITHNHPDEDDEGNGIFEIYEGAGIYGIKLSRQNRGFGYAVQNAADWLIEGEPVQITVTYYAPSAAIQDNSRMGFLFEGDSWYRIRFGANADFAASGLVADEVSSFTITLSEADAAKVLANGSFNIYFWNHNDNDQTGGDYIYLTEIRVHNPLPADKEDLQAAVDAAIKDLSGYTEATASAYTAAIEAAKAVLANEEATAADIEKAIKDIKAAEEALEERIYDVIVVDISTTQGDNPKIGDKVFFTFTVKNNGEETIPAGSRYGGIVKIGDTMIGWSDHYKTVDVAPALAPGETLVLTLCGGPDGADGSWLVVEGAVEVFAQVNDNPGDGINETNLENNTYTETITPSNLDFTDLNEAIAEEVTDLTPYTEESAAAYTAALEAAKALIGKLDATQEQIDAALEALENAYFALTEKTPEPDAILGDVDGDGKITSTDARLTLQYYAEKITENDLDLTVADVDGDGKITSTDARLILQFYAEKIDKFPVAE